MKRDTLLPLSLLAAVGLVFLLPLAIGIWIPDVFASTPRTLAAAKLADGGELRVVQYWNHVDFYTTELWHTSPAGSRDVRVLDGDDCKSWCVPLVVDSLNQTVSVTLCGGRQKTVPLSFTPAA